MDRLGLNKSRQGLMSRRSQRWEHSRGAQRGTGSKPTRIQPAVPSCTGVSPSASQRIQSGGAGNLDPMGWTGCIGAAAAGLLGWALASPSEIIPSHEKA